MGQALGRQLPQASQHCAATGGDEAECRGLDQCAFIDASDAWLGPEAPTLTLVKYKVRP